jgi:hypothetical protein
MYAQSGSIVQDALFRVPLGYNFTDCNRNEPDFTATL